MKAPPEVVSSGKNKPLLKNQTEQITHDKNTASSSKDYREKINRILENLRLASLSLASISTKLLVMGHTVP